MLACCEGKETTVELLLKCKAQVDIKDIHGQTALMIASKHGLATTTSLLLNSGVQVDLQDIVGNTALILACCAEKVEIVELLLNHNAQVDVQANSGLTALMIASEKKDYNIAEQLLHHGAQVNVQDNSGKSALMIASMYGVENVAKLLLFNGAQVDLQDQEGQTALMLACREEVVEEKFMKLLLNHSAQVNMQDNSGQTALIISIEYGNKDFVKLLLNYKARIDLQDHEGKTALILACYWSFSKNVVYLLLSHGAQVNMQDNFGQSALMEAVKNGFADIAELLLASGANMNLHDSIGQTPLIKASETGEKATVELLINWNTKVSDLHQAENETVTEISPIKHAYVQSSLALDYQDYHGKTALIAASNNGHTAVVDLLLEKGAHIDLQDDDGYSALMTACQNEHSHITSHLLGKDADTFLTNREGKTAFDIALERDNAEQLSLFTKLRSKPSYPGILFSEGVKRATITTTQTNIDLEEVGISLSIPENSLSSTDPPLKLEVQPCFSGPFVVPEDVELVSPAYIVKPSRKVVFEKNVLVKIWHHANLETEEDCEDMVFLSASTSPEYRGDTPVYAFKKIRTKGSFRPGEEQALGQLSLKHFCTLAVGKKRKHENDGPESEEAEQKRNRGIHLIDTCLLYIISY